MRLLKGMTALLFDPDFRLSGLAEIRNRTRSIQPTMRRMPGSSLMRVRISSGLIETIPGRRAYSAFGARVIATSAFRPLTFAYRFLQGVHARRLDAELLLPRPTGGEISNRRLSTQN